jgi:hypothetical protein
MAIIITATLNAVATMASLMIKEEKAPFCFNRYLRAMKNERFNYTGYRAKVIEIITARALKKKPTPEMARAIGYTLQIS